MTVSDLIEELQKFPGHHRVFIEHEVPTMDHCGIATDWAAIQTLRADRDCTVVIDGVRSIA
ncbi:hypothetical protein [Paraburkholderia sp. BCC1885]|uniref:hypothetical protein n=1 Tax=Paraburkholderia sp. BCC1885 TaxID=2562669 RepID=UPI001183EC6F|nr:hypothetical protein [Paraburkholderia sp. BCC1885]